MLLSLSWLREFVPYEGSLDDLAHRLTMIGNEVEEIYNPFESLMPIVVGRVETCEKHPEADKLSVCAVDVGDEILSIVCGAPNVAAGQKVPVAKVGTVLPGGLKLKKAKIRGIRSMGMILSEREMELSDDHEGIMVLPDTCKPGERFVDAMGMETVVMDIGVTPNRADCLSVLGLARETSVAFGLPLNVPVTGLKEAEGTEEPWPIEIPEPEYCPMYSGRIIRDVAIAKSPAWMRFRLKAVGVRPISNIVDVTNYVMMELGQPLHSFDMDLLRGGMVKVARAEDGMKLTTLDGQERKLDRDDLLIRDGEGPVALAGVMGGESTEIHDASKNVFLEAAVFRPQTIRRTARKLALPSEASYRFERGVDQVRTRQALDRAAALMAELAGGRVMPGVSVSEPIPWKPATIPFRPARCNALLGVDLEPGFCRATFDAMGCGVDNADQDAWTVTTPPHRLDLEREVDLIEEAGRMHGMDRIPETLPQGAASPEALNRAGTEYGFLRDLKLWGKGAGLREAINYSFVGQGDLDMLGAPEDGRIPIANPLSEDQNVMRTVLGSGLLRSLSHNLSHGNTSLRLFEVAKIFLADGESDTGAREANRLGILLHGPRFGGRWPWPEADADYLDLKGLVEHLAASYKLGPVEFEIADDVAWLDPCVAVRVSGEDMGRMGRVRPEIADACHARREVWMAELDAELLRSLSGRAAIAFKPLPVYPPVRRDITVIAPSGVEAARIQEAIRDSGSKILAGVELVALYRPGGDERNISFRLTYRHPGKTLKDKEVDKEHARIIKSLAESLPLVRF